MNGNAPHETEQSMLGRVFRLMERGNLDEASLQLDLFVARYGVSSTALVAKIALIKRCASKTFFQECYASVKEHDRALVDHLFEVANEVLSHAGIDNREDLEGLAGLIEGCDLVVSVGNATAHLSGALGQRTWVLLPYVAGWRWLHEGSRCPWYQSVRLYRQSERGQWDSVLEAISKASL